jgi:hypothetical protein
MSTRKETVYLLRSIENSYETIGPANLAKHAGYIVLGSGVCEFRVKSDDEQVEAAIAVLEAAKQKEQADSQVRLNKYDEQIQNLRAITHQG